jgi:lipopolysaccharide transport system permease protein
VNEDDADGKSARQQQKRYYCTGEGAIRDRLTIPPNCPVISDRGANLISASSPTPFLRLSCSNNGLARRSFNHEQKSQTLFGCYYPAHSLYYRCPYSRFLTCANWLWLLDKTKKCSMSDLPISIYTPESPMQNPAKLLRQMWQDLLNARELAWRLFLRDVRGQYRQSVLGYLWVFIPPLVASLPFVYLNAQGVVKIGGTPIPYAAYAIIGTTIWQVFADSLNAPLRAVIAARKMLAHVNLPREAILLSALGQVGLGFFVRLVLLVGVFIWFRLLPPPTALLFPLGILSLIMVGSFVGLLLTPMGLLYSDFQRALPIFATFLMLLTPVVYPVPQSGLAATIAQYNPLTPLVVTTRDWLTIGTTTHAVAFTTVSLGAVVLLFLVWMIFRVATPHLVARLGN